MVIFYDKTTLEIIYTESNVLTPTLPEGTIEDKKAILDKLNIDFLGLDKEYGMDIYNYKISNENETLIKKEMNK